MKLKPAIQYTLQIITIVLIALEISIPPNPYKLHLIISLSLLIVMKYDLINRIIGFNQRYWRKRAFLRPR